MAENKRKRKTPAPEQRLKRVRAAREKNLASQKAVLAKLEELRSEEKDLKGQEDVIVMEILHANVQARYGENYTAEQLLEYLSSVEATEEPCAGLARSEQGPEEHREVLGALLPNEVDEGEDVGDSSDVKPLFD